MKKQNWSIILLMIFGICGCILKKETIPVIPIPAQFEKKQGRFIINSETQIFTDTLIVKAESVIRDFVQFLYQGSGLNLKMRSGAPSQIQLNYIYFSPASNYPDPESEGYTIDINENRIKISAASPAGFFYGFQTLRQLMPPSIESSQPVTGQIWSLPCVYIADQPRFLWRGMHLDVCRHFFTKEFVKKYIDILALHKINRFHWHLTEDQGWRIEINKFPRLTEIGAWRVDREHQYWRRREPPRPGEKATYGGYYTQQDIQEVITYAEERFITVIPEIEMPGHATAALAAYPHLSCTGGPFYVYPGSYWPIEDIMCAGNDSTFLFLEGVLDEVIDLFPGPYVHIGGDEANKARWKKCPKCQERIKTENLKDENELQSYFIHRIEQYLNTKGKILIGWDEILEGGLAPNATVMSWRGMEGGIEAANAGHDVVMTPTTYCYFDYYQGLYDEPLAIGGFLPLNKVYEFDPLPGTIESSNKHYILGGQANLWTEFIPTGEHAEYMLLPRLAALSEAVWSEQQDRDFENFSTRVIDYYDRLAWLDYNFRIPPPQNMGGSEIFFDNTEFSIEPSVRGSQIRYTVDGSDPTTSSTLYKEPLQFDQNTWVKARTVLRNGRMSLPAAKMFHRVDPDKNGLTFRYYEGQFDSLPDVTEIEEVRSGNIYDIDLQKIGNRGYRYSVLFEGTIYIDLTGEYTFFLIAEDMGRLKIGENVVVDNSGPYGSFETEGRLYLTKGRHRFSLQYFQAYGMAELELYFKPPGETKQPIPASMFVKSDDYSM